MVFPTNSFDDLMTSLRNGNRDAATELVRQYEPELRRFVRFRLYSSNLRHFIDSLDISQSVLARFFVQLEDNEIEVLSREQLRNLLLTMARNRLYDFARSQQTQKRDVRRNVSDSFDGIVDSADSPSEQVANAELLTALQDQLSERDRQLLQQRLAGSSWEELAVEWQSTAEAIRKQVTRAVDRAARELGVIE